jgi:hypothetical protein
VRKLLILRRGRARGNLSVTCLILRSIIASLSCFLLGLPLLKDFSSLLHLVVLGFSCWRGCFLLNLNHLLVRSVVLCGLKHGGLDRILLGRLTVISVSVGFEFHNTTNRIPGLLWHLIYSKLALGWLLVRRRLLHTPRHVEVTLR